MRHPASAYVQGINDLAAPMVLVFLTAAFSRKQRIDQEAESEAQENEEGKEVFAGSDGVAGAALA